MPIRFLRMQTLSALFFSMLLALAAPLSAQKDAGAIVGLVRDSSGAERTLRQLSADILFLGVDGFDTKAGLFTPNLLECEVNRAMVEITHRTIAVCDSSKFGRRSLCNIMPVTAVHEVITDKQIPKADLYALKEAGIRVTLV